MDGIPVPVIFSGPAPGLVGLYRVNGQVPENALQGEAVPVGIHIGEATFAVATVAIR